MKASARIIRVMHNYESCRLDAYPDPGSKDGRPWTIGWGHTGPEVVKGLRWTQEKADQVFLIDLQKFEGEVGFLLSGTPCPQYHFDALVSFAYNLGSDIDADKIAEGLGDSTLLRYYLEGRIVDAANEFLKWNKNDGKVMNGLIKRRAAERDVFLNDSTAETAIAVGELAARP